MIVGLCVGRCRNRLFKTREKDETDRRGFDSCSINVYTRHETIDETKSKRRDTTEVVLTNGPGGLLLELASIRFAFTVPP